jgi:myo-inositol catabolism protein IolC
VELDVWKVEGFDCKEDFQKIVAAARGGGRGKVGCVLLGRGQGENTIRKWLTLASEVARFIGFAIGRTDFRQPLAIWRAKGGTREAAVEIIARGYRELVDIFEKGRPN